MNLSVKQIYEKVADQTLPADQALQMLAQRKGRTTVLQKQRLDFSKTFEYDETILKDHRVFGEQVLLGVVHCSLAIQAAKAQFPDDGLHAVEKIKFLEPIRVASSQKVTVQTKIEPADGRYHFKNQYRFDGRQPFRETAAGELVFDQPADAWQSMIDIQKICKESAHVYNADDFYRSQDIYGPAFFTIGRVYRTEDGVVGEYRLTPQMLIYAEQYTVHPAILDAGCTIIRFLFTDADPSDKAAAIPLFIRAIRILADIPQHGYCYCKLVKQTKELVVADSWYYDPDGHAVMAVEGLSVKRVLARTRLQGAQPSKQPALSPDRGGHQAPSTEKTPREPTVPKKAAHAISTALRQRIEQYLVDVIKPLLKDSGQPISNQKNFMDLGVESTQLIEVTQKFEKQFNIELYPTLFFEYPNIKELAAYFQSEHTAIFAAHFGLSINETPEHARDNSSPTVKDGGIEAPERPDTDDWDNPPVAALAARDSQVLESPAAPWAGVRSLQKIQDESEVNGKDIAVIGMDGIFAGSPDLNAFWYNLREKKDLIREIPLNHFDYRPWFDPDARLADAIYCKWGSFIDDVDCFDASFFKISPREAELMDPQLRLLLQVLYTTTEDAGYAGRVRGTRTGMFVGVCFHDYQEEMARVVKRIEPHMGTGNATTMIANRPSFHFDITGPSIAVDTACSSSLVAMHLACKALQNDECEMAFAAGTNLLLGSGHYRYFCSIGALSYTGRCHTFDKRADGYVPGEGVAALLLKPLPQAIADQDRIHAVIKGSAVNHGGYTPSVTAPSAKLEAQVILDAWRDAAIDPGTIGYIEAHGTGTKLGDPVEINALKKAFKQYGIKEKQCALGSAKAHIGHTEGTAGIAGVVKAILSLKHRQIPPMPKFEEINPYIQLHDSPFYINQETVQWERNNNQPRRAGVNSFGFGGAYAHVVLEEYDPVPVTEKRASVHGPRLIVLSAHNPARLKDLAESILNCLNDMPSDTDDSFSAMAYTLQTGREALEERMAVVALQIQDLKTKLTQFCQGQADIEGLFLGNAEKEKKRIELFVSGEAGAQFIQAVIQERDYNKLAQLWVAGVDLDWRLLYPEGAPQRIALPSYPFAKERYWMAAPADHDNGRQQAAVHPLIERNTSTFQQQEFTTQLTDPSGRVAVELNDLSMHAVAKPAVSAQTSAEEAESSLLYCQAVWEKTDHPIIGRDLHGSTLIFDTNEALLNLCREQLDTDEVLLIKPAEKFSAPLNGVCCINPENREDYVRLVDALFERYDSPGQIIHLWSKVQTDDHPERRSLSHGIHLLLYLSQALMQNKTKAPIRLLYIHADLEGQSVSASLHQAVSGFAKTIRLENPKYEYTTVAVEDLLDNNALIDIVLAELQSEHLAPEVRYAHNRRWIRQIKAIDLPQRSDSESLLKHKGVYLITGGLGALGVIFAEYLACRWQAQLVLTGRSELNAEKKARLQRLRDAGTDPVYVQADTAKREDVQKLTAHIRSRFHKIDGIIHAAGVLQDALIPKKTAQAVDAVLAPKIQGLLNLDDATRQEPLDFFVLFSSIASVVGNPGQCDYAYANGFMDCFAAARDRLRKEGRRLGKTLSINWPLWKAGGMQIDAATEKWRAKKTGVSAMLTESGLQAFESGLASHTSQLIVFSGFKPKLIQTFMVRPVKPCEEPRAQPPSETVSATEAPDQSIKPKSVKQPQQFSRITSSGDVGQRSIEDFVENELRHLLKISEADLGKDVEFVRIGMNSIVGMELAHSLTKRFKVEIHPDVLLTHNTLRKLSRYIFNHEGVCGDFILNSIREKENKTKFSPRDYCNSNGEVSLNSRHSTFPLSSGQLDLWTIFKMAPDNYAYNVPFAYRVRGRMEETAIRKALESLAERHSILRAVIRIVDNNPVHVIKPDVKIDFNARKVDKSMQASPFDFLRARVREPFDLETGPMVRVDLYSFFDSVHILLITIHHIICDGLSLSNFIQDFGKFYQAEIIEEKPKLSTLSCDYADFVRWEKEYQSSENYRRDESYWLNKLSGALPVLDLPTDRTRPKIKTYEGKVHNIEIPSKVMKKLKALAAKEKAYLFSVLLSIFKTLLYRYTHQTDIIVGTPLDRRQNKAFDNLVGYFLNWAVIKTSFAEDWSFRKMVRVIQNNVSEAIAHGNYPFSALLNHKTTNLNENRSALFQVGFTYLSIPQPKLQMPEDLQFETIQTLMQEGEFDLSIEAIEGLNGCILFFKYNPDLFDLDTIEHMGRNYLKIVEGVINDADQQLSKLELLSNSERSKVLYEWNNNKFHLGYMENQTIHELIESQADRTPEVVAVVFRDESVTYNELNKRANQLSHHLIKLGVARDQPVAIRVERGINTIICILAVLKAGGAYMPLDPDLEYPQERLKYIISESKTEVLLTQQRYFKDEFKSNLKIVYIDKFFHHSYIEISCENPSVKVSLNDLAYVLYTSGSTGKPKGAMISHRNVLNLFQGLWQICYQHFQTSQNIALVASFTFDASVQQYLPALFLGHKLHIMPDEVKQDPDKVIRFFNEFEISISDGTPTFIEYLVKLNAQELELPIKKFIIGGEAFPTTLAKKLYQKEKMKKMDIINIYGPTECCVDATSYAVPRTNFPKKSILPIGRPLANLSVYILDKILQPVPIGVFGEIFISGPSLGRGYISNNSLTSKSFIKNPFIQKEIMYRTGDLGRWLHNGNIEFRERIDNQIKIRGYRVECGEIEECMKSISGIENVVVEGKKDLNNLTTLCAYYISSKEIEAQKIKDILSKRLPHYMIPSLFMRIEKLPMSSSGKIARKYLPEPNWLKENHKDYVAPKSKNEKILTQIWAKVLQLDEDNISIHDNLFEIGGNSLYGIQIAYMSSQAGLKLKTRDIIENPTIYELAKKVSETKHPIVLKSNEKHVSGVYELTPIQMRFIKKRFAKPSHYNEFFILEAYENLDFNLLFIALKAIAKHHDALRMSIKKVDGIWKQIVNKDIQEYILQPFDLSGFTEEEKKRQFEQKLNKYQTKIRLTKAPLFVVLLFKIAEAKSKMVIALHHMVTDMVSCRIIMEDFERAYQQLRNGKKIALPPQTSTYGEWSTKLIAYANENTFENELEYWGSKKRMEAESLPNDYPNESAANIDKNKEAVFFVLDEKKSIQLSTKICKKMRCEIHELLLTVIINSIKRWIGAKKILIDMRGHGREEIDPEVDVSRTVGWFTKIYPAFFNLKNIRGDFISKTKHIKKVLKKIPMRGINYGIIKYIKNEPAIQNIPNSQVCYNYVGEVDQMNPLATIFRTQTFKGMSTAPQNSLDYLLTVDAGSKSSCIFVRYSFSRKIFKLKTMLNLIRYMEEEVEDILSPEIL